MAQAIGFIYDHAEELEVDREEIFINELKDTDKDAEIFLNYSRDDDVVINEKSLYELASTTKAFTALGILQLEKEGRLELTDSVDRYVSWFEPEFGGERATITIRQLLEHTSGIPAWTICLIPSGTSENSSLHQTVEKIKSIKLENEPGRVHEYATINYDILALIIEEVTGQKYEDYMKENVLEPLEMQDTFFRTDNFTDKITQGNRVNFLKSRSFDAPAYYGNIAAGYLDSNTVDLMKWIKNVNRLFDFDGFTQTKANHYYAGWNVYDNYVCHSGNNPNYSSQVIISRNDRVGVFALSALSGSSATEAAENIYRMHLGESIKIGLYIDDNALLDFAGIIAILILIYLMLPIRINSKRKAICSLLFALSAGACFAIMQIWNSVVWLKLLPNSAAKG